MQSYVELITCILLTTLLTSISAISLPGQLLLTKTQFDTKKALTYILHRTEVSMHGLWASTLLNRHENISQKKQNWEQKSWMMLEPNFLSVAPRTWGSCKESRGLVQTPGGWSSSLWVPLHLILNSSPFSLFIKDGHHLRLIPWVLLFKFSHEH